MACRCCDCECAGCEVSIEAFVDDRTPPPAPAAEGHRQTAFSSGAAPDGAVYADGYPGLLDGCLWFWWHSFNECAVAIAAGPPVVYASDTRYEARLYKCVGGTLRDITSVATTNGPFQTLTASANGTATGTTSVFGGTPCPDGPRADALAPLIVCP